MVQVKTLRHSEKLPGPANIERIVMAELDDCPIAHPIDGCTGCPIMRQCQDNYCGVSDNKASYLRWQERQRKLLTQFL